MALSAKVAVLACLSFTAGMCWLVNQVARPMIEMPSPAVVRAAPATGVQQAFAEGPARGSVVRVARRFACPSLVERALLDPQAVATDDLVRLAYTRPQSVEEPPGADQPLEPMLTSAAEAGEQAPVEPAAPTADAGAQPATPLVPIAVIVASPVVVPRGVTSPQQPKAVPVVASAGQNLTGPRRPRVPPGGRYVVRRGDTLYSIARRCWGRDDAQAIRALVAANPRLKKRRNRIFVGEALRVPPSPEAALAVARGPARSKVRRPRTRVYTVKRRDTLASIARRELHDPRRWREIARLNNLKRPDRILPGTRIVLPASDNDT